MILFLDFDGVMHANFKDAPFSRAPLLWELLRALPAAKVVISSSWREDQEYERLLKFLIRNGGEDLKHRFLGVNPIVRNYRVDDRQRECKKWLVDNNHTGVWIAIDDMPELFAKGHPNLHVTDGMKGLTDADVQEIIEKLTPGRRIAE